MLQTRVIATWALGLVLTPLAGCGMELVRPAVDPPASETPQVAGLVPEGAACDVAADGWSDAPGSAEFLVGATYDLAATLRAAGVFRAGVTPSFAAELRPLARPEDREPKDPDAVRCVAQVRVARVSEPKVRTAGRDGLFILSCLSPVFVPLNFIWTDREPELAERYTLDVTVLGEDGTSAAHYEALAHGTISAQSPDRTQVDDGLVVARDTLRALAIRALVSRFTADTAAHERLSAQLSNAPAADLEPLLVSKETYGPRARWRTRRLIAWRNEWLAPHVAEAKTSELRALSGRLEICMVDLMHEAEVQKDSAQAATARGAEGEALAQRALSLAYLERVEALRPILAAVKEEVAARAR